MDINLNIDYNQILALIRLLPEREIERLAVTLNSEVVSKQSSAKIEELIKKAPTWSDSDYNDYLVARDSINKSRIA